MLPNVSINTLIIIKPNLPLNKGNANLQLRSDPPVPKANVGPFLNSTIEPEQGRPLLEIGA